MPLVQYSVGGNGGEGKRGIVRRVQGALHRSPLFVLFTGLHCSLDRSGRLQYRLKVSQGDGVSMTKSTTFKRCFHCESVLFHNNRLFKWSSIAYVFTWSFCCVWSVHDDGEGNAFIMTTSVSFAGCRGQDLLRYND